MAGEWAGCRGLSFPCTGGAHRPWLEGGQAETYPAISRALCGDGEEGT